jgi:soluble lytic murein transglycosylase
MNWLLSLTFVAFLFGFPLEPGRAFLVSGGGPDDQEVPDSVLALVRGEFEAERFWHGVERLREALGAEGSEAGEVLLLLAEGEVGWRNWPAARELLKPSLSSGALSGFLPWFLLGRALEELGDLAGAVDAYSEALEGGASGEVGYLGVDPGDALLRRSRARSGNGDFQGALEDLRALLERDPARGRWLALELAREGAEAGATEATRLFLSSVSPVDVRKRGWDLPARALLSSGDSAGAEAAYWSSIPSLTSGSERGSAWERVGSLRLARDDSVGARAAYHQVLREDPRGGLAMGAAKALLSLGFDSASVARQGAEALARGGRGGDAFRAYEAYGRLSGAPLPREVSLALARIHLTLREPRNALILLDSLAEADAPGASAPVLVLQAQTLRALGRSGAARAAQDTLVALYPNRPEAVEILFLRADALQDQGDIRGAVKGFEATAELSPTQNLAGQARMRLGQIHLSQGREEEAARVFNDYMEAFPEGRRWDEAAFWAGRTLLSLGREEEGRGLLDRLRRRFALSFYSVQAGVLLGESYDPGIPEGSLPTPLPRFIVEGMARIDALRASGLEEGAGWETTRLMDSVRGLEDVAERRAMLLRLASALNARGLTREGINLGWEVRRLGADWDRDLLSAVYPFPYRQMAMREAEEEGLDPFLMAGLMRQESAFWHKARSRADARGLMQLLPATGAQLARARGPEGFQADQHLYQPEINVHLGMAFFSDLRRRFGEDLSILLSAYNAGPTRATRWREYPEAGDLTRFVERIPFSETRGYVKNVLLNREIYAWLYGPAGEGG